MSSFRPTPPKRGRAGIQGDKGKLDYRFRGNDEIERPEYLDLATRVYDLKVPPSNRLHKLEKDRKGQYSISVNQQWRICFRFVDGDAYDVEVTDYH